MLTARIKNGDGKSIGMELQLFLEIKQNVFSRIEKNIFFIKNMNALFCGNGLEIRIDERRINRFRTMPGNS